MLLTRRHWATLLAALPLAAQQIGAPPPQPAPAKPASASDDVLKVSQQLAQIEVPMSIEPAFTFHAL